jgi:hypothetical protein
VSTAAHDDVRAAAALLACTATGRPAMAAVMLDGLDAGQLAGIAAVLARWLAAQLAGTGTRPRDFALGAIAGSIAAEAAEAAEATP